MFLLFLTNDFIILCVVYHVKLGTSNDHYLTKVTGVRDDVHHQIAWKFKDCMEIFKFSNK